MSASAVAYDGGIEKNIGVVIAWLGSLGSDMPDTEREDEPMTNGEFHARKNQLAHAYLNEHPNSSYTELYAKFREADTYMERCFYNELCNILLQETQRKHLEKDGLVWDKNSEKFVDIA